MGDFIINHPVSQAELEREWDLIAATRHAQQISGRDESFNSVLKPAILQRLGPAAAVLDAGCGTGILTDEIASRSGVRVTGVDPSRASVELARRFSKNASTEIHVATLEEWSRVYTGSRYDLITANMVLMDAIDLLAFLRAARKLLKSDGRIIATVVHPNFWPRYWGYENLPDFDYLKTATITGNFRIGHHTTDFVTTHIHRPLSEYVQCMMAAGFLLKGASEMYGPEGRTPSAKRLPRFLLLEGSAGE